jgi:hypothetical protein
MSSEKVDYTGSCESPAQTSKSPKVVLRYITQFVVIEVGSHGRCAAQWPDDLATAAWRQRCGQASAQEQLTLGNQADSQSGSGGSENLKISCREVALGGYQCPTFDSPDAVDSGGPAAAAQTEGVAPRSGEDEQLTLGNQADSLSGSGGSENLKISCREPPALGAEQSARFLGCVDGKEPKLEDFDLAILEHQAILYFVGSGDGRLQVDWSSAEPSIHQPVEQPQGGVSVPVPAPGFPVPCLGGETQGQVQGGLSTDLRVGSAKGGLCQPEPLAVEATEALVPSLFGVPDTFREGAKKEGRDTGQAMAEELEASAQLDTGQSLLEELEAADTGQSLLEELEACVQQDTGQTLLGLGIVVEETAEELQEETGRGESPAQPGTEPEAAGQLTLAEELEAEAQKEPAYERAARRWQHFLRKAGIYIRFLQQQKLHDKRMGLGGPSPQVRGVA